MNIWMTIQVVDGVIVCLPRNLSDNLSFSLMHVDMWCECFRWQIWRLQGGPKLPTIKSSAVGNCEQQRLNRQGIRDDKPREQKTKSTDSACVSQTYLQSVRGFVSLDNQPAKNDSRMIRDQYTDISNHRTPRSHSKLWYCGCRVLRCGSQRIIFKILTISNYWTVRAYFSVK